MEYSGKIVEKFVKYLTPDSVLLDEMRVPASFRLKHEHRMDEAFYLILRTGYRVRVEFDKERGTLSGVQALYEDFNLVGGELLVFELTGSHDFHVYVIGVDFAEIEYPSIVHTSQKSRPLKVSLNRGGFKFVQFVTPGSDFTHVLGAPKRFMDRVHLALTLTKPLHFVLSNGKRFDAKFDKTTRTFNGLHVMCECLGLEDLNGYNMLLFTYEEVGNLVISVFDDDFVEIRHAGTPLSIVPSLTQPAVHQWFEITVMPFHMNQYCHGVDISAEFKQMWYMWGKTDYINVYSGSGAWKLQVRRRRKWERTTIHDGWIQFRDEMNLDVGDKCIFECPRFSYKHYSVRVVKSG